jgi:hypothetical protein
MSDFSPGAMRSSRALLVAAAGVCLLATGCAQRVYVAAPPPAPLFSPLLQEADRRGFHAGHEDGVRDAVNGLGYHPKRDRKYAETPGYEAGMGPYPTYRDTFRSAYLRGYADGFNRR